MNKLFFLILTVVTIVPFGNDIFVSALPEMALFFNTKHAPLVISFFLLGLAIAQPFYGPLSDRFGRRPVLLVGLWIYTIASAYIIQTTSFPQLITARLLKEIAGSAAALFNFISFVGGSIATVLTSFWVDNVLKFALFIIVFSTGAILIAYQNLITVNPKRL